MGQKRKIKPHQTQSILKATLEAKSKVAELTTDGYLLISFRHLDKDQGQSLDSWQEDKILAPGVEVIANSSNSKLTDVFKNNKCTIYGNFPPKEKTTFTHPKQVPPDANWARVHVNGKQCIIGHVVSNTFYIVFLDKDHEFWDAPKRHT